MSDERQRWEVTYASPAAARSALELEERVARALAVVDRVREEYPAVWCHFGFAEVDAILRQSLDEGSS